MPVKKPTVVIVGGGFGGLSAARHLKNASVNVILIDRLNHHLFQPLLYQVATSVLAPSHIAAPLRTLLRGQKNTRVFRGEVTGVDHVQREVIADTADRQGVRISYDYLILATGASHNYFGHEEFAVHAPGMKSLADAVHIRNRILQAFEQADTQEDTSLDSALLTFVLVGGGPTGVELSGALAVMVRNTLSAEYHRVDLKKTRIVLVNSSKGVLGTFAQPLGEAAAARLRNLGVEILEGRVEGVDADGVIVSGQRIASKTVIWTAGVTPSPAGKWLGVSTDRAGRVEVKEDCSVPDRESVFVIGDTASFTPKPLPGVAQVALQQGRYVGRLIDAAVRGRSKPGPFNYFDKGNMAVVGQGFAVLESGQIKLSGRLAWLAWCAVHLEFLAKGSLRVSVFLQWAWAYLSNQRGSRLIIDYKK